MIVRYAWRQLQNHPGRTALSVLSVVIATAAVIAVAAVTMTTRSAFQQVFESLAGPAQLEIVGRGSDEFAATQASAIRNVPGVRTTLPVFRRISILYHSGQRAKVLAIGIDANQQESLSGMRVIQGILPRSGSELALETKLASGLNIKPHDTVKLLTSRGMRRYQVVGLYQLESAARVRQGAMLLAPLAQLQSDFRAADKVDSVQVFLDPGAAISQVEAQISKQLPPELQVQVPSARHGLADETLILTNVSLSMASALSLTTAVFIVLGVFLMNVGERRQQLSLMHAIGATKWQILQMICVEALMIGAIGALLGIPLGAYGGQFLITSVANLLHTNLPAMPNPRWAIAAGIVSGPVICLLAALYPAVQASRVSPLEGMRPNISYKHQVNDWTQVIPGTAVLAVAILGSVLSSTTNVPLWVPVASAIFTLVAIVLLLPVALRPLVKFLPRPLLRPLGIAGEIAERVVLRRIGRSALATGVLFMAIAAAVGVGNAVFGITHDVRRWYQQTTTADFLLRTMMPDLTGAETARMSDEMTTQLAALPGVARVEPIRAIGVSVSGQKAILVAREFGLYPRPPLDLVGAMSSDMQANLLRGDVVVGSVLASRVGIRVGDEIPLTVEGRTHNFRVAGIVTEYSFGGLVILINRPAAQKAFEVQGVDCFLVKAAPGARPAVRPQLEAIARSEGLLLQSFEELLDLIDSMVGGITSGLWVLLALGVVVGGIGLANTLSVNVLEQSTEIGLMRAVGMTRSQLLSMVVGQAVIISTIGIAAGTAAGLSLAHGINYSLGHRFGREIAFSINVPFLLMLISAAIIVALAAAILPAWRAVKLDPMRAMQLR